MVVGNRASAVIASVLTACLGTHSEAQGGKEPSLPKHTFIETTDGKLWVHDLGAKKRIAFLDNFTIVGTHKGSEKQVFIKKVDAFNLLRSVEILSLGLEMSGYEKGRMLVTKQDGTQYQLNSAFFNSSTFSGKSMLVAQCYRWDAITEKEVLERGVISKHIKRIVFADVRPLRCCGKLFPPDYKFCPLDGKEFKK